jgi:hypothetical protein
MIALDVDLAGTVVPYVVAAAGAYGAAVVERIRDDAADTTANATVTLGQRILRRIMGREQGGARPVVEAVQDLAIDATDSDAVAALRLQLRKLLAADPALASELAQILTHSGVTVTASGKGAVAMQHNTGIVQTGNESRAIQEPR